MSAPIYAPYTERLRPIVMVRTAMTESVPGKSISVLLSIAAAAAALAVAGCGDGSSRGASSHATTTVGTRSDSAISAEVTPVGDPAPRGAVRITTPYFPAMITAGGGSIWVFTHRDTLVYRIDPRTNRIVATINMRDTPCTVATFGAGLVWNSNCGPGENSKGISFGIDPHSNRVTRRIPGNFPVVGAGSLWVLSDDGRVMRRVDPRSGVVLARVPTGVAQMPGGGTLTIGGTGDGSVWLASDSARSLTRISTAHNRVTDVIPLVGAKTSVTCPGAYGGFINGATVAFAAGKAWYANPAGVFEVNPRTNHAKLIRLHMCPFSEWGDDTIVSGAGSVWLRTADAKIARINPATGRVQAWYPAGFSGGGGDLVVAFGSLWVANAGSDSVWREPVSNG